MTQLDFSDNDHYLEMSSQKVAGEQRRDFQEGATQIFIIWDIALNQIVSDLDKLRGSEWPDWSLSSSIFARY